MARVLGTISQTPQPQAGGRVLGDITPQAPQRSLADKIWANLSQRGEAIVKQVESTENPLVSGLKATAQLFGGIGDVATEVVRAAPVIGGLYEKGEELVQKGFSKVVNYASPIGEKLLQLEQTNPETAKIITNFLEGAGAAGEISGNILAAEGMRVGAVKTGELATKTLQKSGDILKSTIKANSISDLEATGKILQGQSKDVAGAIKTIQSLDTRGVKTYKDLGTVLSEKVKTLSQAVDEKLGTDTTPKLLNTLSRVTKVGETSVSTNYVKTALNHLKEFYSKTISPADEARITQLIEKAEKEGLTAQEINNIAREYGTEFRNGAFNPRTGEAITSVNAKAFENVRKGVKGTARDVMPDAGTQAIDEQITNALNTKRLVDQMAKKVNALEQRVIKRNILEKVARKIGKTVDIATFGAPKAFITKLFFPSNVGLKTLNSLDLQEMLAKNLKIIQRTANSTDTELVNMLAEKARNIPNNASIKSNIEQSQQFKNFSRDISLSAEEKIIENKAISKYLSQKDQLVQEYIAKNNKVANADEARKLFKDVGYKGYNAASVQETASALNKDVWNTLLKNEGDTAIIYAGGSGSGKTSAIKNLIPEKLSDTAAILDGNLSKMSSAEARIKEALEAGKTPVIPYAYRDPIDSFVNGVVKRMLKNTEEGGRIVPTKVVAENHMGSYDVVKKLFEQGKHDVILINNDLGAGKAQFMSQAEFNNIKFSKNLLEQLNKAAKKLYDERTITKQQYEAFIK